MEIKLFDVFEVQNPLLETTLDETISLHGPLSAAVLGLSTMSHAPDQQMDGVKRLDESVKSTERTLNFSLYKK